eukprot:TRINITY_DN295_c0_g1_i1.p1 TRINITY_DN295_c0_g1~~TRINITY_DN295_c0_g1_i1.p1  ORF type:complete len:273 (-),score=45.51 TRINITY_DN295_c0_g1_i1:99-857(-)
MVCFARRISIFAASAVAFYCTSSIVAASQEAAEANDEIVDEKMEAPAEAIQDTDETSDGEVDASDGEVDASEDETDEDEGPDKVVELTAETFHAMVQGGRGDLPWFIKFYAPWCGHCQQMAPAYKKLAGLVDGVAHVAKVDITKEESITEEFEVGSFPTLLFIVNGLLYRYNGARDEASMAEWINGPWKSASSEKLPGDMSFADRFIKRTSTEWQTFNDKTKQVHQFMPSVIPLAVSAGSFFGGIIAICLCA